MHHLILWAGFLGAWALVAGPLYQAMLELHAEDIEVDRFQALTTQLPPMESPSRWWLLVPPVYFTIRHRRREEFRTHVLELMTDQDFEALVQFMNKAVAWMMVGFGGLMIALKETYELVEGSEWSILVFWVLALLMLVVSVAFGASRIGWTERELRKRKAA